MNKKILIYTLSIFSILSFAACNNDNDDTDNQLSNNEIGQDTTDSTQLYSRSAPVTYLELPNKAQIFLETYFSSHQTTSVIKEKSKIGTDYEVMLDNGIQIEFNESGDWKEVDGKYRALPTEFIPSKIVSYINEKFPNISISKIEKDSQKYEVELKGDIDLVFSLNGDYLKTDADNIPIITEEVVNGEDMPISYQDLPSNAQTFLETYFSSLKISSMVKDKDYFGTDYEVMLDGGIQIEFDENGNWKEVDGQYRTIPTEFIPVQITSYIKDRFPNMTISKIEKNSQKYEVELNGDLDLEFSLNGDFLRID